MQKKHSGLKISLPIRKELQNFALLTLGSLIMAANFDIFLAPFNIAPGGISGMAIIIHEFTGWLMGLTYLILNIPMLIIGFCYLGRFRFLLRAFYVSLVFSLSVDIFGKYLSNGVTDDLLLNALYGGVLGGIGIGLIYRGGTSPAGTSVISRVLNLKTGIPNSQVYIMIDGGVILTAGLVFGWEMALYAFVTLFTWGVVADYVLEGPSVIRSALIVTDRPGYVSEILINQLGIGVTSWPIRGMYTHTEHTALFCALNRSDVKMLKTMVKEIDPAGFVVIMHGQQALGGILRQSMSGNKRKKEKDTPAAGRARQSDT